MVETVGGGVQSDGKARSTVENIIVAGSYLITITKAVLQTNHFGCMDLDLT